MEREIKLHPIEKEILRTLDGLELTITHSQIAKAIGVHPNTAKKRLEKLKELNLVNSIIRGNRSFWRINLEGFNKKK